MLDQVIINLYDEYTHKPLSRLEFIQKLTMLAGSMPAAMSILPLLESNYTQTVLHEFVDLYTERINYPGVQGEMKAYFARPKDESPTLRS